MLRKRFQRLTPQKQLKLLSRLLIIVSVLLLVLLFSSLVITASNLMITNQLNTQSALQKLSDEYPLYLISQNLMVAMDVLLLLSVPLLIFSVFTFQQKGNAIIMIYVSALVLTRWIGGLMLLTGGSTLREGWDNMWSTADKGNSPLCLNEACKEDTLNYVMCGKLSLWKQLTHFEVVFSVVAIILGIAELVLAYFTNKWDLKLDAYAEEQIVD